MMDLVERELTWVIRSPNFYSPDAADEAERQTVSGYSAALPGPLIAAQKFDYLSQPEIDSFLSRSGSRQSCLKTLRVEVPQLASGRLGIRFELYLHQILKEAFGTDFVKSHVAVREELQSQQVKTWGEYDFLVLNTSLQRVEHWESSIKFYLQVKDDPAWKWCWGPGRVDRLDLKGPKTFLQQLALSSTELGRQMIPSDWRELPLVKRVFAKGTIFYRWQPANESLSERLSGCVRPSALASNHLQSWWITPDQVKALREHFPNAQMALIPRKLWMTGLDIDACDESGFESWDVFESRLDGRLDSAAERNECLYAGIYSSGSIRQLISAGFIVTRPFLGACSYSAI